MTQEQMKIASHCLSTVQDALRLAQTLAGRAADLLDGTDGVPLFTDLAGAIHEFERSNPAMTAVKHAALPRPPKI